MIVVSLDAMGGDHAPREIVRGAVEAIKNYPVKVLLVGPLERLQAELDAVYKELPLTREEREQQLELVPADQVIEMGEEPALALRRKKNAS
ncbi:MAG: phosphate acyltransferase, partial [Syntrophomonadaceae bacterium]|nr:phosphate acyltransferase [Syntrophomonadaceae bacterium]